jgi:hypothetical protein
MSSVPERLPKPAQRGPLSLRMKAFADEYLTGEHTGRPYDGKASAIHAGYNPHDSQPYNTAHRLLRHPAVKAYINKRLDEQSMSGNEIIARITDIARAEPGNVVKAHPANPDRLIIDADEVLRNRRFIKHFGFDSNGNPKIEFHDAHVALRDLARVRGLLKEGLEVSGPNGGPIPTSLTVHFIAPNGEALQPQPVKELPAPDDDEDYSDLE